MLVHVACTSEFREDQAKLICHGDTEIAIFKHGTSFYAIGNVCAHQHFSVLHQGEIDGCHVTCPMHGWKYDIRTGRSVTGEGRVSSYPVTIIDEKIMIEFP